MHTILSSATKTVRIGDDQPFAIIGERINPTGRKIFQQQLRTGDLSRVEIDVKEQADGGAMLLDVNMGAPLADEAELMRQAVRLIQQLTDLPLVIDSSIIEVLDAGLAAYQGKALVNSVTAEDERLEAILPLVRKYGAAVIGLPNDEEEIPESPARRVELARKLIHVATERYKIPIEDIVIDPLAMPVGADTLHPSRTLETIAMLRAEFGVNMTLGASNVSFGMPDRHSIAATFLPIAMSAGLTSAIMDARAPQIVRAVKAADLVLNRDEWGGNWIAAHRAQQARDKAAAEQAAAHAPGPCMTVTDDVAPGPVRVNLLFNERPVRVPYGVTLFDAASWNGIAIDSTCGGHGTCKKCRVRIAADPPAPSSLDLRAYTPQEIKDGWRLACRTPATRDTTVEVPPLTTRPKAATVGVGRQVILRPAVQKRYLELAEPSLADQASDLERVLAQLDDLEPRAELPVLQTLGRTLRAADYKVTAVVVDDVLIAVEPGDTTSRRFGIAFDLGTTTVVATLLDLSTGTPAAVASTLNKQQPFGADVITRISATMMDPGALDKLQQLAQETLGELAQAVCADGGVRPDEVYEVALAGNATMTHIVLGIDPEPLGMAPFIMSTRLFPEVLAAELGLAGAVHPRARAVMFPSFGAYVGGDIMAGLLASGMDRDARVRLFVDIGTNCEIVLGNREWLLATAAPAGPAFEGAAIRCGMRAADGAIEVVGMTADELTLKVIGDAEPLGLCGSGLVDAVTGLVALGLVDSSGRFVAEEQAAVLAPGLAPRLTRIGQERVFVLHWRGPEQAAEDSIYLSQRDVRELQFAKAAIATGWRILLAEAGLTEADVKQVLLAGSFGSYLSPAAAIRIGLVPRVAVQRVVPAGNVAGEGAKMALLSLRERAGGLALLEEVRYVELSDRPDFNDQFVERLSFPEN